METNRMENRQSIIGTKEWKALYEKTLPDGKVVDLYQDALLRELIKKEAYFELTGGAVVDIFEGRKPKDYDFINISQAVLEHLNFKYNYETATATTYVRESDGIIVQCLKTSSQSFDFTISNSRIYAKAGIGKYITLFYVHPESYLNKLLIPQSYEPQAALNSLMRIPHWRKKGYEIHDMTYYSLLKAVASIDGLSVFKSLFKNS